MGIMEEKIISFLRSKNLHKISYNNLIEEMNFNKNQQWVLMSRIKTFKKIKRVYSYNDKNKLVTYFELVKNNE